MLGITVQHVIENVVQSCGDDCVLAWSRKIQILQHSFQVSESILMCQFLQRKQRAFEQWKCTTWTGASVPRGFFFCKAGCKQKADSSTGLKRQFPLLHPCLRKWTRCMNDQCQISLVPVHFCNSCVSIWLRGQTFTLELHQETIYQKAHTWNKIQPPICI